MATTSSLARPIGSPSRAFEIALDVLEQAGAKTVLDCPAGEGPFCERLLQRGFAVAAADIVPDNFRLEDPRCDFADLNDRLPYADASFDAVACLNGLQRVWARARAMGEFARVLKPGGTLIASFPNNGDIRRRLMFFLTGSVTWSVIGPPHAFVPGAVNPAGCFRSAMTLADMLAGVSGAGLRCDHVRATHCSKGALSMAPLTVLPWIFGRLSPKQYKTVYNRDLFAVRHANSAAGLFGAFLVMVARKPLL